MQPRKANSKKQDFRNQFQRFFKIKLTILCDKICKFQFTFVPKFRPKQKTQELSGTGISVQDLNSAGTEPNFGRSLNLVLKIIGFFRLDLECKYH